MFYEEYCVFCYVCSFKGMYLLLSFVGDCFDCLWCGKKVDVLVYYVCCMLFEVNVFEVLLIEDDYVGIFVYVFQVNGFEVGDVVLLVVMMEFVKVDLLVFLGVVVDIDVLVMLLRCQKV